ncbi:MAG: sensor histidine kinase [Actinomycetota bacterium]|nr:sensor histidine kinase [Actinomycetota bacterium]
MRARLEWTINVPSVGRLTVWDRLRRANPYVWDVLLAVTVFAFAIVCELWFYDSQATRGVDQPSGLALIALACAPLAWRRRAPLVVLATTAIAVVAYGARGYPGDFVGIAFVVALYSAAAHRDRRLVLAAALPIALAAAVTIYLTGPNPPGRWQEVVFNSALLVGVPLAFGRFEFNRRRRILRDRERTANDAVAEERARIARELHDVVAHAMGVMIVQAGAARVVIERDPEEAAVALRRIEDTGRAGLGEMRRLIAVLGTDGEAAREPQPGLDRMDELLETMRGTGLPVEAIVEGRPRDLPSGVDLTAFRVMQEALTNALKHAGDAHARVLLRYSDEALELEIADDGRGPQPEGDRPPGNGLLGMRERVAMFGGSLETGPRPGGGFVVRARIPTVETA